MRKTILLGLLICLLIPGKAVAFQSHGIGLIFIEPTGLSWKIWLPHGAFQAAAGWSSNKDYPFIVHADYQFIKLNLYRGAASEFSIHAGFGGRMRFHSQVRVALRMPLSIDFMSKTVPLNFFLEAVPMYLFDPEAGFDLKAALGVRYLFN